MARGGGLNDLVLIMGLGIVGYMAYNAWYKGQDPKTIVQDINTKLTGLLDNILSQFPALPPIPQIQFPQSPSIIPQVPPAAAPYVPTTPAPVPTNTVTNEDESIVPEAVPAGSGQQPINPKVPAPPAGSGGAIVAFAGDFDTNARAKQTVAQMKKQNVGFIVGCGDYSYGPAATQWFNEIITADYKGKMKGAQGNHDNDSYLPVFGQSKWLDAFKVAPNLAVVTIDTEGSTNAAELDAATTKAKGMGVKHIAYVMHKAYITSSDGHHKPSENKSGSVIDAAAKKHGVKLVVSGHNHVYEHFFCNGIHYVTSGAAGREFYKTGCKACSPVKCINSKNGFLKVSVGASLLCQFVENSGAITDTFTVS